MKQASGPISAHGPVAQHWCGWLVLHVRPTALPDRPYGPAARCRLVLRGAHGAPARARAASLRRKLGGIDEWRRGRGHGGGLIGKGELLSHHSSYFDELRAGVSARLPTRTGAEQGDVSSVAGQGQGEPLMLSAGAARGR
jgi:hypothetical protein